MNRKEFKQLFDQYFPEIRRYIFYRSGNEDTATDVAQEAFMKIWEKRDRIEIKTVRALLYKISIDLFISKYRKEKREFEFFNNFEPNDLGRSPEEELQFEELKQEYERALKSMPEKQRTVFLMSRVEELTYQEIADKLELTIKAIEKRMSQALKHLKEKLNKHYEAFINLLIVYRGQQKAT